MRKSIAVLLILVLMAPTLVLAEMVDVRVNKPLTKFLFNNEDEVDINVEFRVKGEGLGAEPRMYFEYESGERVSIPFKSEREGEWAKVLAEFNLERVKDGEGDIVVVFEVEVEEDVVEESRRVPITIYSKEPKVSKEKVIVEEGAIWGEVKVKGKFLGEVLSEDRLPVFKGSNIEEDLKSYVSYEVSEDGEELDLTFRLAKGRLDDRLGFRVRDLAGNELEYEIKLKSVIRDLTDIRLGKNEERVELESVVNGRKVELGESHRGLYFDEISLDVYKDAEELDMGYLVRGFRKVYEFEGPGAYFVELSVDGEIVDKKEYLIVGASGRKIRGSKCYVSGEYLVSGKKMVPIDVKKVKDIKAVNGDIYVVYKSGRLDVYSSDLTRVRESIGVVDVLRVDSDVLTVYSSKVVNENTGEELRVVGGDVTAANYIDDYLYLGLGSRLRVYVDMHREIYYEVEVGANIVAIDKAYNGVFVCDSSGIFYYVEEVRP